MSYTILLKEIWNAAYDTSNNFDEFFEKYIHHNYCQCINDVSMNRDQYKDHLFEQRLNMKIKHIDYKHIVECNNELFALYYPKCVNKLNQPIEAEVIAYFQFEGRKILKTHGQVQLLKGDLSDVDM